MINVTETGATVVTGKHIQLYRLIAMKQALILESRGLRMTRGGAASTKVRQQLGIRGNREKLIAQLQTMINQFDAGDEEGGE
jgi:hypothetical protein